ncbi:MAG: hypothetical protein ACTHON_18160 [Humibacter sp.]
MLFFFAPVLAFLGAAIYWHGRYLRGLLAIATALATELAVFTAAGAWPWVAFVATGLIACAISIARLKRET